jgi:hypothetical protein
VSAPAIRAIIYGVAWSYSVPLLFCYLYSECQFAPGLDNLPAFLFASLYLGPAGSRVRSETPHWSISWDSHSWLRASFQAAVHFLSARFSRQQTLISAPELKAATTNCLEEQIHVGAWLAAARRRADQPAPHTEAPTAPSPQSYFCSALLFFSLVGGTIPLSRM